MSVSTWASLPLLLCETDVSTGPYLDRLVTFASDLADVSLRGCESMLVAKPASLRKLNI